MTPDSLIPADLRPWFILPAIWRQSMDTISDKAWNRLEAVQYHLAGVPIRWRDGFAIAELSDDGAIRLDTDFKRPEDLAAVMEAVTAIATNSALAQLPSPFQMRTLRACPDWYRRYGFRVPLPPAWELTCNVLYCPGGKWGTVPAIDLGAISA